MKTRFNLISFISLGLLFSFIVMLFSGIVLYIAPEGSISRWMEWKVLGLSKKQWEHQHTIFSYVFIVFSLFHIFKINWQLMYSYFKAEKFGLVYIKELLFIVLLTILVFAGTLNTYQPFKWVLNAGTTISENIGKDIQMPTIANPEKLNMEEFAIQVFQIPFDSLKVILKSKGFSTIEKDISFESFSKKNKITPEELYKLIKN